ncbi:MAG: phospho-N-acetylmuramoyl-pentapeptide-transferase [Oscillospiraceae bacterium]|nr:phospho-N-acetylmuramoyl-pentapeptide-transferase [Oscillospiraceae bacterium]
MIFDLLESKNLILLAAAVLAFGLTLFGILGFTKYLPKDHGREFAVNGALSKGKARGAGIILISALIVACVVCIPLNIEMIVLLAAIFIEMMSGFLDDAAKVPWGELKKGLIDLVVSIAVSFAAYRLTDGIVMLPVLHMNLVISMPIYMILGTVLVWASINVTNCSDGVDGLCTSMSLITLISVLFLMHHASSVTGQNGGSMLVWMTIFMLIAYLWFNCSPSSILMGDAGSRALGLIIAVAFMLSDMPFLFIPCALMLLIDGGLGLVKLTILRLTKSKTFMKNIRTPIHDHARKNKGWSDTQVVIRFTLIQMLISAVFVLLALGYAVPEPILD